MATQIDQARLKLWQQVSAVIRIFALFGIVALIVNVISSNFTFRPMVVAAVDGTFLLALLLSQRLPVKYQVLSIVSAIFVIATMASLFLVNGFINFITLTPLIYVIGIIRDDDQIIGTGAASAALLLPITHLSHYRFLGQAITAAQVGAVLSWSITLLLIAPFFVILNRTFRHVLEENQQRRMVAEELQAQQQATLLDLERKTQEQAHLLELVQDLETPIIPILATALTLPIVGYLDAARAQRLTTSLLQRIANEQINCVLVDVTGMKMLDQQAFDHLVRLVQAVRLMGTDCIVTGIRPDIARGLVAYGMDATRLKTTASLHDGIALLLEEHTHTTNNYN